MTELVDKLQQCGGLRGTIIMFWTVKFVISDT
jgi:hypothetical protein